MRFGIVLNLAFSTKQKRIQTLQCLFRDLGAVKTFTFESKFKPLPVIWHSLLTAIADDNCKINGQALGGTLKHSLGESDG